MWLWASELHRLGFKRKSERYWQCERRYGLPVHAYLSLYPWCEHTDAASARQQIEVSAFHVTFQLGLERIHFYYHEYLDNEWEPGGHTSTREILRVHDDPVELRRLADAIAAALLKSLGCLYQPRPENGEEAC